MQFIRPNFFIPKFFLFKQLKEYNPQSLSSDLSAGFNVALLAIPQGMAYSLVAGLPIKYGLLGSAIAAFTGGIFGGGKFITQGPTNATAVLLFGVFASAGLIQANGLASGSALEILPLVLLCTGLFLILASVLRVSFIVQFVSRTVVTAYITAASFLILANQARHVLGITDVNESPASTFWGILNFLIRHIEMISLPTLCLSIFTGLIFLLLQILAPAIPGVAISLVISSLGAWFMGIYGIEVLCLQNFSSSGNFFHLPNVGLLFECGPIIFTTSGAVCLLCLLEGLSIGKSLSARAGARLDANQETFSIGLGNLGCSLFSGMPASGSLTRSSLNVESGAKTSIANIFAGLFVLLGFWVLGDLVSYIPLCSLATVVIFIGISLIKVRQIKTVSRTTRSDAFAFGVTFFVGLTVSLQFAIFAGVITSILLFLRKVAQPQLVEYGYTEEGRLTEASKKTSRPEPEVSIVHVEGELFFAAADLFYDQIRRVGEDPNLKVLVLKMLNAHHLDATSVLALEELFDYLKEKNCHVLLCEVRKDCLRILKNSGVLARMNRRNIFPHVVSNPTLSTAKAIKRAKFLVDGVAAKVTIYADHASGP
jgi:SulP family sulfate permease